MCVLVCVCMYARKYLWVCVRMYVYVGTCVCNVSCLYMYGLPASGVCTCVYEGVYGYTCLCILGMYVGTCMYE
jgi:hypothetical protein